MLDLHGMTSPYLCADLEMFADRIEMAPSLSQFVSESAHCYRQPKFSAKSRSLGLDSQTTPSDPALEMTDNGKTCLNSFTLIHPLSESHKMPMDCDPAKKVDKKAKPGGEMKALIVYGASTIGCTHYGFSSPPFQTARSRRRRWRRAHSSRRRRTRR